MFDEISAVQAHWKPLLKAAQFILFEPLPNSFEALEKWAVAQPNPERWLLFKAGLSKHDGRQVLHAHNVATGSSLLPPDESGGAIVPGDPAIFPVRKTPVDTIALAAACDDRSVPRVDLFKIGAQGAELPIVRGFGEARLGSCWRLRPT